MSSSSHSDMTYKVHSFQFNGRETRIVCHNPTHACPPLIAVCNHFLLTKPSYLNLDDVGEFISQSDLQKRLASLWDKTHRDYKQKFPELYEETKQTIDTIPEIASSVLLDNTNLQPFNTLGTQDFTKTVQSTLFRFLDIPLHHGWIVEPTETHICNAIGAKSSAELRTTKHPVIQKFLKASRTELTSYGISCLTGALDEGQLAGLYRKDNVSLFYKHQGTVYVLETNKDRLNNSPSAMWKSLTLVHGDEVFFTSEFIPLPADVQPSKNGKQWVIDREAEAATAAKESEGKEEKKNKTDKRKKKKKKKKSKQVESDKECQNTEMGSQSSADESTQVPMSVERDFLEFLEGFTYEEGEVPVGEDKVPYFVAQMDFMKRIRSFNFSVLYADIEKFNKELASAIRSDKNRLTNVLTQSVIMFLISHDFGEETLIRQKTNLIIHDVPVPESVQLFKDFVNDNILVWPYQLHNKKWVNATSFVGRRMGKGYLDEILRTHKEGRSWAGKFEESDMKIIDGCFVIDKYATEDLTQQNIIDDLDKFIKIMSKYFVSRSASSPPAYFNQFQEDLLTSMPNYKSEEFQKFQKYLSNHFAFKAPLVRSTVIRELFVVCQSRRVELDGNGRLVKGYKPLDKSLDNDTPWNALASKDSPYFDVYTHENTGETDKFGRGSFWNVLQYSRHFIEHMLDHTKDNGVQQVKDIIIADLMLGDCLEAAMANLILEMMYQQYDGEFFSVWRHFEESEYNDDPENADAAVEPEVSSVDPATI